MFSILLASSVIAVVAYLLNRFFTLPHDSREPVLLPSKFPILGHVAGILYHGSLYYEKLSNKFPDLPIYTLDVPGSRIYIVTAPELVPLIDRRPNTFSFAPMVIQFAKRLLCSSQESVNKLAEYVPEKHGDCGLLPETLKAQHESLAPGKDLEAITRKMLKGVLRFLDSQEHNLAAAEGLELCDFFRKFITIASTEAVYGTEHNPYQDYNVIQKLWDVYHDFGFLGLNIFPELTAPKGSRARRVLFNAMHKFYAAGGHKSESASRIIKARFEVNQKYDIPVKDIEHFDLSISFGLLANAAPTSFWLVYYLYSDPMLLTEVRANIHESLVFDNVQSESSGKKIVLVNIPDVIARCPLLASFVSEVLRVQSVNASARVIREDTILDNKYLLKKNSFIFIPSASLHKNEKAWGPTASAFNPHRFNTQKKLGVTRENRIPVSAHRSWGGGVNLCPGRFFAMNELLSILIIMALKYDVHPISGVWQEPPRKVHVMASIMEPARDLPVRIKKRENVEALEFKFVWQSQNDIRDS